MEVKPTAEIIDSDGNIIGTRTRKTGGVLSLDEFDLSTKERLS